MQGQISTGGSVRRKSEGRGKDSLKSPHLSKLLISQIHNVHIQLTKSHFSCYDPDIPHHQIRPEVP